MKKQYLVILGLLISLQGFSQQEYINDTLYKYFIGTKEPDAGWKEINYNDDTWLTGCRSIGYGEKESTELPVHTQSVYIRNTFTVDSAKKIHEASLLVDYDDGFIAYLNGIEIIRVNLGNHGNATPYNRLTDRSHEIIGNRGSNGPLDGYYIDTVLLHKALVNGKNVLSVQIHNDSINGSDLYFDAKLYNLTDRYVTGYDGPWHVIKQTPLDSSLLPIISIETNEFGIVTDTGKVPARMTVYNNTTGSYNKQTDVPQTVSNIGIKLHGNSTLQWPKKNYTVETRDSAGKNLNIPLLGLPAENDWIFNGPFADKSNIRNVLAFSLGKDIMSDWTPRTKYFELLVNGEFLGLYVLIESIKRDSNRVDIKKLKPKDVSDTDLTGGYIFKMDQNGFEMVYPKPTEIQTVQKKYIQAIYSNFITAAKASTPTLFLDSIHGFRNKIDVQNYSNYTIVNEVVKNADAYQYSVFMHKDRDDINPKLLFGPIWDFDLSCGNIDVQNANKTAGWQFAESSCFKMYQKSVFRDSNMVKAFKDRWFELRKTILDKNALNKRIDSIVAYAGDALKRNYEVWPYDGKKMDIWGYQHPAKTYQEDIAMLKSFLSTRIDWIDANIKTLYYGMPTSTAITATTPDISFPNPFKNELRCTFELQETTPFRIEIYSTLGQKIYEESGKSIGLNEKTIDTQLFAKGIYYIVISGNNIRQFAQTIIKE